MYTIRPVCFCIDIDGLDINVYHFLNSTPSLYEMVAVTSLRAKILPTWAREPHCFSWRQEGRGAMPQLETNPRASRQSHSSPYPTSLYEFVLRAVQRPRTHKKTRKGKWRGRMWGARGQRSSQVTRSTEGFGLSSILLFNSVGPRGML